MGTTDARTAACSPRRASSGKIWVSAREISSAVRRVSLLRRKERVSRRPSKSPSVTSVFPTSIASSIRASYPSQPGSCRSFQRLRQMAQARIRLTKYRSTSGAESTSMEGPSPGVTTAAARAMKKTA